MNAAGQQAVLLLGNHAVRQQLVEQILLCGFFGAAVFAAAGGLAVLCGGRNLVYGTGRFFSQRRQGRRADRQVEKFFSLLTVPDFRAGCRKPGNGSIGAVKMVNDYIP